MPTISGSPSPVTNHVEQRGLGAAVAHAAPATRAESHARPELGMSTISGNPSRVELAEQRGYGAAVQQQAQQLRPAACVALEIGEPGLA